MSIWPIACRQALDWKINDGLHFCTFRIVFGIWGLWTTIMLDSLNPHVKFPFELDISNASKYMSDLKNYYGLQIFYEWTSWYRDQGARTFETCSSNKQTLNLAFIRSLWYCLQITFDHSWRGQVKSWEPCFWWDEDCDGADDKILTHQVPKLLSLSLCLCLCLSLYLMRMTRYFVFDMDEEWGWGWQDTDMLPSLEAAGTLLERAFHFDGQPLPSWPVVVADSSSSSSCSSSSCSSCSSSRSICGSSSRSISRSIYIRVTSWLVASKFRFSQRRLQQKPCPGSGFSLISCFCHCCHPLTFLGSRFQRCFQKLFHNFDLVAHWRCQARMTKSKVHQLSVPPLAWWPGE